MRKEQIKRLLSLFVRTGRSIENVHSVAARGRNLSVNQQPLTAQTAPHSADVQICQKSQILFINTYYLIERFPDKPTNHCWPGFEGYFLLILTLKTFVK